MTPYAPDRRSFLALSAGLAAGLALKPSLAQAQDVADLTLKRAAALLRTKSVSPLELTEACLKRIEKHNPTLNAFIAITADEARATAKGMQVSGAPFAESKVLLLAHVYEQATDWHRRHPNVDPA